MSASTGKRTSAAKNADGDGEVYQMLVRLPKSLHERLRQQAFNENRKKAVLIREALDRYLD